MQNDEAKFPHEYFVPFIGKELTKAGLGRINRSIEAFIFSVVGSQVNVRSIIFGDSGSAQECQQEMIKLLESAIIEEDISKSVQISIDDSRGKMRLNYCIAPKLWLIPEYLNINTESKIGYCVRRRRTQP